MLQRLRNSKLGILVVLIAALKSTIIVPVQQLVINVGSSAVFAAAATGATSSLFTNLAWANKDDDEFQELLKGFRSQAADINSKTKANTDANLGATSKEHENFLMGQEEDRAYSGFHEMDEADITNENIRNRSVQIQMQLENDTQTTEGQVYHLLKGIGSDESYHTRDRDHQDFADKITMVDSDIDPEFSDAYNQISGGMSDGMMCRPVLVSPAEYETKVISTEHSCSTHTGEAWVEGSCIVQRNLQIPMLQGGNITNKLLSQLTRSYESPYQAKHSFTASLIEEFSNNFTFDFKGQDKTVGDANEEYEIKVNGQSRVIAKSDISNSTFNINRSELKDGENSVELIYHPFGFVPSDTVDCSMSEAQPLGIMGFTAGLYVDGRNKIHIYGDDYEIYGFCSNNEIRLYKGILIRYNQQYAFAGTCIRTNGGVCQTPPHHYRVRYVSRYMNEGTVALQGSMSISNEVIKNKTEPSSSPILKIQRDDYKKLQRKIVKTVNGLGIINKGGCESNNDECISIIDASPLTIYNTSPSTQATTLNYQCHDRYCITSRGVRFSNPIYQQVKTKLKVNSQSFKEEALTEIPDNCLAGKGQSFRRNDGYLVTGLKGVPFPVENYTEDGISDEYWECTDYAPTRQLGSLTNAVARANEIGEPILRIFPNVKSKNEQICYEAKARNYAVDITSAPLCKDNTLDCYGEAEEEVVSITDRVLGFFVSSAKASMGGYLESDSSCEALAENPSCRVVKNECVATSSITNSCMRYDRVYECDETKEILVKEAVTKRVCEAAIPCSNGEDGYCSYDIESSGAFQDAAVLLSVSTFARNDQNCFSDDPSSCQIFSGRKDTCRSSFLFGTNCCKESREVSKMDYIQAFYSAYKIDFVEKTVDGLAKSAMEGIGQGVSSAWEWATSGNVVGDWSSSAYDYASDLAGQAWDSGVNLWNQGVTKTKDVLSGAWESLFGNPSDIVTSQSSNLVSPLGSMAQQHGETLAGSVTNIGAMDTTGWSMSAKIGSSIANMGKEYLGVIGDFLFDEVLRDEAGKVVGRVLADGTVEMANGVIHATTDAAIEAGIESGAQLTTDAALGQLVGTLVSAVMMAYMIYSIAKLIYGIMTQCDSSELALQADLGLGNCMLVVEECRSKWPFGGCKRRERDYCCFMTPLARIIHEQSIKTAQHPFSTRKSFFQEGNCRGLWFSEFSALDFSHPNFSLDEWVSLLMDADKLPKPSNLDKFFNEDTITKSTARMVGKEDESGNASERAQNVVGSFEDVEEIRRLQKETLLAQKDYAPSWRGCGYIHDVMGGRSFDGREEYADYAGDRDVVITSCEPDMDGQIYNHQYESCKITDKVIYETYVDEEGNTKDKLNDKGDRIPKMKQDANGKMVVVTEKVTPKTIFFIGRNEERVDVSICNDAKVIMDIDKFDKKEWRSCGFEHNESQGISTEKLELIGFDAKGKKEVINACSVRENSKKFKHEQVDCGYHHTSLTETGVARASVQQFFMDDKGVKHEVAECKPKQGGQAFKQHLVNCGYEHDLDDQVTRELAFLVFTNAEGVEMPVKGAEACEVRKTYPHKQVSCGVAGGFYSTFTDRLGITKKVPGTDSCKIEEQVPNKWVECRTEHEVGNEQSKVFAYMVSGVTGNKIAGLDKCELRFTYKHEWISCTTDSGGAGHYVAYKGLNGDEIKVPSFDKCELRGEQ